jgi:hypothetical protein
MIVLAERSLLTANNEPTPEEPLPREMTPRRAGFLMIATLLLLCGSMLLFLDVAANASGTHGQVAMIGLVLVAIGGSYLWADFFDVPSWFARERWVTGHVDIVRHQSVRRFNGGDLDSVPMLATQRQVQQFQKF